MGFADEIIHLFLATGISDVAERPEVEENERIDIEVRPLSDLDAILTETTDSKTLIALYRLRDHLRPRLNDPLHPKGVFTRTSKGASDGRRRRWNPCAHIR